MYSRYTALMILLLGLSFPSLAAEYPRIFVSHEFNDTDSITSVGVAQFIPFDNSDFGSEAFSSFSSADVMSQDGNLEGFFAWDAGFRMGYYGPIAVYIEAGVDMAELILEREKDECCISDDYNRQDYVDGFVGLGLGLQIKALRIDATARLRQIDARYWKSESHAFIGMAISVQF